MPKSSEAIEVGESRDRSCHRTIASYVEAAPHTNERHAQDTRTHTYCTLQHRKRLSAGPFSGEKYSHRAARQYLAAQPYISESLRAPSARRKRANRLRPVLFGQ